MTQNKERKVVASYPIECQGSALRTFHFPRLTEQQTRGVHYDPMLNRGSTTAPVLPREGAVTASLTVLEDGSRQVSCPFLSQDEGVCIASVVRPPGETVLKIILDEPTDCIHLNPSTSNQ